MLQRSTANHTLSSVLFLGCDPNAGTMPDCSVLWCIFFIPFQAYGQAYLLSDLYQTFCLEPAQRGRVLVVPLECPCQHGTHAAVGPTDSRCPMNKLCAASRHAALVHAHIIPWVGA